MATKAGSVIDAWLEVAQDAIRIGAEQSVATDVDMALLIDVALVTTTAHTGTRVTVQISEEAAGDGFWTSLQPFIGPLGTAVTLALDATEPIGETSIACTNPVTANMDNDGKFKFIEHATDADSEIVYQTANSADAGDTVTIAYGLANEQTSSSALFDIDDAVDEAVIQRVIPIPASATRVRVIYDNKYDPDGSAVFTRCRLANMTDAAA